RVRRLLDRRRARGTEPDPRGRRRHPAVRVRGAAPAPHRGGNRPAQRGQSPRRAQARPPRRRGGGAVPPDPRRVGGPRPLRDHVRGVGRAPRRDHEAVPHLSETVPGRRTRSFSTEDAYGLLLGIIVLTFVLLSQVEPSTILGAVCAYMLIGMLFGFTYALIARVDPPFFANHGPVDQFDYFYFSYACLTTVGFGDFVSRGDFGRSLSVLEAVTGQI